MEDVELKVPNAQRNRDFVYDSAEAFGFLAPLHSHSALRAPFGSYNTAYLAPDLAGPPPKSLAYGSGLQIRLDVK